MSIKGTCNTLLSKKKRKITYVIIGISDVFEQRPAEGKMRRLVGGTWRFFSFCF